ncbi:hypothetical protein SNE40_014383 [Patella caerulea]|uniref:Uncharacterized protein n=1 Tax=Patella caerulea TaxID=87958 RepID=A0AAN8JI76_PATCE
MTCDMPCISYMALYIISMHIVNTNSRSSNHHWRLNQHDGKIVQAREESTETEKEDEDVMNILTNKVILNGEWKVEKKNIYKTSCFSKNHPDSFEDRKNSMSSIQKLPPILSCGKPVNDTQYDHLRGIANRQEHAHIPEPEVAMIFRKKGSRTSEIDLNDLEQKLWKAKKELIEQDLSLKTSSS